MKKKALMIILLLSMSFAESYKIGNTYFNKSGIHTTFKSSVYDKLEYRRSLDRQLSVYFRKKNSIITMKFKKEKRKHISISSLLEK